jgi:hypothetical protein
MPSRTKKPSKALVKAFYAKNKNLTKADLVLQLKVLVHKEAIEPWFKRPNKHFLGLSPNQVIDIGSIQLVQNMILDMASGNPG